MIIIPNPAYPPNSPGRHGPPGPARSPAEERVARRCFRRRISPCPDRCCVRISEDAPAQQAVRPDGREFLEPVLAHGAGPSSGSGLAGFGHLAVTPVVGLTCWKGESAAAPHDNPAGRRSRHGSGPGLVSGGDHDGPVMCPAGADTRSPRDGDPRKPGERKAFK